MRRGGEIRCLMRGEVEGVAGGRERMMGVIFFH